MLILIVAETLPISDNNKADVIEEFGSTSRYMDNLIDVGGSFFINKWYVRLSTLNLDGTGGPHFGLWLVHIRWLSFA